MVSKENADYVLQELQEDPANSKCFDCGGQPVNWASVSHGSFLCSLCAGIHRGLGAHISFIRSLSLDEWTSSQLKQMSSGGNSSLATFMGQYDFPDKSIQYIYRTKAASYYRSTLKSLSESALVQEPPPSPEEGIALETNISSEEDTSIFKNYYKKALKYSKEKYQKFKENEKVQVFSAKTADFMEKVSETTREWSQKPAVIKAKEETSKAFNYVAEKSKDAYETVKAHPKVQEYKEKLLQKLKKNPQEDEQAGN